MGSNRITSLTNAKIKQVMRLRTARGRQQSGLTVVEGAREVRCARQAGIGFVETFYCPDIFPDTDLVDLKLAGETYEVTDEVFAKIAFGDRREGILAVCRTPDPRLEDLPARKDPFYVVVAGVEKPGNLGAILRTCDGASVDSVIVCDPKVDLFSPNVIRASLGTVFTVKAARASSEETLAFLKKRRVRICAATPSATALYTDAPLTGAIALAVGAEDQGLSGRWLDAAAVKVRIPMQGQADSLNVAASTAVLVYEAVRQRGA